MQHTAKGKPKIVKKCSLPVTAVRPVELVVTELAVIAFADGRATLRETAPGISVADVIAATEAELVIPHSVPEMPLAGWHLEATRKGPPDARAVERKERAVHDSASEGQASRRQEGAHRRHRQRSVDRVGLCQGVPRFRRRTGGDLSQRQGEKIRRAARART